MAKRTSRFECSSCGGVSAKWVGQCPACGEWNTVEEVAAALAPSAARPTQAAVRVTDVDPGGVTGGRPTGIDELDRVLGGGLSPGSVTLVGGEPGIGKSTLLLQMAASIAAAGRDVLYVSAEESPVQVRRRAERIGALVGDVWLAGESDIHQVVGQIDAVGPAVVIVDSIQTVLDPEIGSVPGSVPQVRACADRLVRLAKARPDAPAVVLVGQVTKDGGLAGPRTLEHVVDTVLQFEGDEHYALRTLRATKHRFGATGELGLFTMGERGLSGVDDPSEVFLADRRPGVPGSVVAPVMEGARPVLVEVQALVAPSPLNNPRRSAQGLPPNRLAMVLAVLERRAELSFVDHEVFASVAGGARVTEPALDLAVALALASAHVDRPLPGDLVACGEVGLAGELRQVAQSERRLAEAARMGFRRAVVPSSMTVGPPGLRLLPFDRVGDALAACAVLPEVTGRGRSPEAA